MFSVSTLSDTDASCVACCMYTGYTPYRLASRSMTGSAPASYGYSPRNGEDNLTPAVWKESLEHSVHLLHVAVKHYPSVRFIRRTDR